MQESQKNDLVEGLKKYYQKPIIKLDGFITINCSHCGVLQLKEQTRSDTTINACYLCHGEFCSECSMLVIHRYKQYSYEPNRYLCATSNMEGCWSRYKKYRDEGRNVFKIYETKDVFINAFFSMRRMHYDGFNSEHFDVPTADPWKYHGNITDSKGNYTKPGHVDRVYYVEEERNNRNNRNNWNTPFDEVLDDAN